MQQMSAYIEHYENLNIVSTIKPKDGQHTHKRYCPMLQYAFLLRFSLIATMIDLS